METRLRKTPISRHHLPKVPEKVHLGYNEKTMAHPCEDLLVALVAIFLLYFIMFALPKNNFLYFYPFCQSPVAISSFMFYDMFLRRFFWLISPVFLIFSTPKLGAAFHHITLPGQ